jgi:hypothetical protein
MEESYLFTAPWPGPGDSEGPVDPEGWTPMSVDDVSGLMVAPTTLDEGLSTGPLPGPGNSEGEVEGLHESPREPAER